MSSVNITLRCAWSQEWNKISISHASLLCMSLWMAYWPFEIQGQKHNLWQPWKVTAHWKSESKRHSVMAWYGRRNHLWSAELATMRGSMRLRVVILRAWRCNVLFLCARRHDIWHIGSPETPYAKDAISGRWISRPSHVLAACMWVVPTPSEWSSYSVPAHEWGFEWFNMLTRIGHVRISTATGLRRSFGVRSIRFADLNTPVSLHVRQFAKQAGRERARVGTNITASCLALILFSDRFRKLDCGLAS